jgi:hypothetical protein
MPQNGFGVWMARERAKGPEEAANFEYINERAFAATVTEANPDSKLLLALLNLRRRGTTQHVRQTLRWESVVFDNER